MSTVGVVVGNPKPRSRTLDVATHVADAVAHVSGLADGDRFTLDLAELGPQLFDWSSGDVAAAVTALRGCAIAIVASPTYKATYTGLLKSFLDWFSTTDLNGVTAIPVMVGAGPQHALAVEVHLRPLLVELGATVPTRGLYVLESQLDVLDEVVTSWLEGATPELRSFGGGDVSG